MKSLRLLLVISAVLLVAVAAACGSDEPATDSSGRSLPPTNGQYDRILRLAPDDVATPDFTLGASNGQVVRFSEIRGQQPVVVVFYRGFF